MPIWVPPYLTPTDSPGPLYGSDLEDFMHDVIAGITGLGNTLVTASWQPEPDNIPPAGTVWCAFGFQPEFEHSQFPVVLHDGNGNSGAGVDTIQQHETFTMLTSFYDLGAGADAQKYCALLRDGLFIAQNREEMLSAGIVLISISPMRPAPVLVKERWLYRIDLAVTLRRQIDRTYGVPNVASAQGTIYGEVANDSVIDEPINVEPPS